MKHTKKYFDDVIQSIDESGTPEAAEKLAEELEGVVEALREIRTCLGDYTKTDLDFLIAIDNDLEHYEGLADKEAKRAHAVVEENQQEIEDEETYGTYSEQVRSIYSSGCF